jgi:chorismate mutase/prephenate dehydrogenase
MGDSLKSELDNLRSNIDEIDFKIIELLAKRKARVDQILAYKKEHGISVSHPAREEDMISKRRSIGEEKDISPDYLEELFRTILRQSRVGQTESKSEKGVRPGATVLIAGGTGGMGKYYADWFVKSGYETRILGSKDWENVESLCNGVDLALISVPIDKTLDVIEKISSHLPEQCILADLTSIKKSPVQKMMKSHKGPVLGTHPLFGPTTSTMDKQIIVITPGRDPKACKWFIDQLSEWGAVIVESDEDEHDRIMAVVQALRHFATFSFGKFLFEQKIDLFRSLEFSSPIYRLELGMVGRLFAQDPDLYSGIIFASSERRSILKSYISSMMELTDMIDNTDREEFGKQFKEIADWFGPFSEQAMRESTFLIEKLIERF